MQNIQKIETGSERISGTLLLPSLELTRSGVGNLHSASNKKIKLHQPYHPQSARLHQHLQLSSYPLPSWRFAYLGDSLSSCPEQCLRGARTTQHTWILALNIQFDIQKYLEKNADTVQKERIRQAVKSVLTNNVIVPRFNQSIFFTFSVLITNIVKLKIEKI